MSILILLKREEKIGADHLPDRSHLRELRHASVGCHPEGNARRRSSFAEVPQLRMRWGVEEGGPLMRRMSFALTTDAIRNRTKTVTRRLGWNHLKIGERIQAVDKLRTRNAQKLAVIEIVDVRKVVLSDIDRDEVDREGFPDMCAGFFVAMFCESMGCEASETVTRIEFRYVDEVTP